MKENTKKQLKSLVFTEYNILAYLSEHSEKLLTYSSIIKAIWHEPSGEGNIKKLQVYG